MNGTLKLNEMEIHCAIWALGRFLQTEGTGLREDYVDHIKSTISELERVKETLKPEGIITPFMKVLEVFIEHPTYELQLDNIIAYLDLPADVVIEHLYTLEQVKMIKVIDGEYSLVINEQMANLLNTFLNKTIDSLQKED